MCGIAGAIGIRNEAPVRAMIDALAHRGPDHSGIWMKDDCGLGHARLSIIDTSAGAHQPMVSPDGRFVIAFNGEIYNFQDLRQELARAGHQFLTASDTEVILALYAREGAACFEKLHGMFAIAIHDTHEHTLVLVRDRMGEKPLYWSLQNGMFAFASELKGLLVSGLVRKEVDRAALADYLQFDFVPTPKSLVTDVYKLEPATVLTYKEGNISKSTFWTPPQKSVPVGIEEAKEKLDALLSETVKRELVSDVPIGIFLSGGIDSSTIAYYAQQYGGRPMETFSIGFDDPSFDESAFARRVAEHLGTAHHEQRVGAADALALVPELGDVLSEPIADASIIPTLLLSRFARTSVTVALGGDGGDELYAGYPTFQAESWYRPIGAMPDAVRRMLEGVASLLPASHENFAFAYKLQKLLSSGRRDPIERHLEWLGTFDQDARTAIASPGAQAILSRDAVADLKKARAAEMDDSLNALLFSYARGYLMDQVLVKVDRASMRYGLETRAPLLDHAIVDFSFSLPYELKYHRGTSKYLLKELMKTRLPSDIVYRAKKGFGIPLARWLAGPLRPLCEDLLSRESLAAHGLFSAGEVERLMKDHVDGKRDNRKELWNLMVFQLWHRRWMQ